jgi:hypothetical protein
MQLPMGDHDVHGICGTFRHIIHLADCGNRDVMDITRKVGKGRL